MLEGIFDRFKETESYKSRLSICIDCQGQFLLTIRTYRCEDCLEKKRDKRRMPSGAWLRMRFKLLEKYDFTCQYCGRKAPEVTLEIDHIYPKSKGGTDDESNLIVACKDCNLGKTDFILGMRK